MKRLIGSLIILHICIATDLSNLNKFSHNKLNPNLSSLELEINLESSLEINGYKKITGESYNHTIDLGFPELPTYTTFYQIDSQKEYEVELIIHDSYTIDDMMIYPHQGNSEDGDPFLINNELKLF